MIAVAHFLVHPIPIHCLVMAVHVVMTLLLHLLLLLVASLTLILGILLCQRWPSKASLASELTIIDTTAIFASHRQGLRRYEPLTCSILQLLTVDCTTTVISVGWPERFALGRDEEVEGFHRHFGGGRLRMLLWIRMLAGAGSLLVVTIYLLMARVHCAILKSP